MAPELRKRKAPPPVPEPPAKKPAKSKVAKAVDSVKEAVVGKPAKAAPKTKANGSAVAPAPVEAPAPATSAGGKPVVGEIISLEGFGGEIETNDGTKTTLKALVDESKAGVVLFTYPKASTPGCKLIFNHSPGDFLSYCAKRLRLIEVMWLYQAPEPCMAAAITVPALCGRLGLYVMLLLNTYLLS